MKCFGLEFNILFIELLESDILRMLLKFVGKDIVTHGFANYDTSASLWFHEVFNC